MERLSENFTTGKEDCEKGGGTVLALLFCLVAITLYLKFGQHYAEVYEVSEFYHILVLSLLGIVTVFTLGCGLHMVFIGDRSAGQLKRDIRYTVNEYRKYIADTSQTIEMLEQRARSVSGVIRPRGLIALHHGKRILNAIAFRLSEAESHARTSKDIKIIDVHEFLFSDLDIQEDCLQSVIAGDPIPPIPFEEWKASVESYLREYEMSLERLAA